MSTETWLILGLITGSIGLGYFVYGKKTGKPVPMIAGLLLMVYMYAFDNGWAVIGIGLVLVVLPFVWKWEI
jgi:hypothetical protein